MTELEVMGFKSPSSDETAEEWLMTHGSIARARSNGDVDVIIRHYGRFYWTCMDNADFKEIIPEIQRQEFLTTTTSASYHGWLKTPASHRVFDVICFYDARVFSENTPNHMFETLPETIRFINTVWPPKL